MAGRLPAEGASVTMRLPAAPSSVRLVRNRLSGWMRETGYPTGAVEDARTIISELVANSVLHARPLADGTIEVGWVPVENGVELTVTDGGAPTRPHLVAAPPSALAGRGMAIVDALAESWWLEDDRSRSVTHALLPVR